MYLQGVGQQEFQRYQMSQLSPKQLGDFAGNSSLVQNSGFAVRFLLIMISISCCTVVQVDFFLHQQWHTYGKTVHAIFLDVSLGMACENGVFSMFL